MAEGAAIQPNKVRKVLSNYTHHFLQADFLADSAKSGHRVQAIRFSLLSRVLCFCAFMMLFAQVSWLFGLDNPVLQVIAILAPVTTGFGYALRSVEHG